MSIEHIQATRKNLGIIQPLHVFVLLMLGIAVHTTTWIISTTLLSEWRWVNVPIHSVIEAVGAMIAFFVAHLLLQLEKRSTGTSANVVLASALTGMGMLDLAHALVEEGQAFVFLHSLATFLGGLLFAFILVDRKLSDAAKAIWHRSALFISTLLGIVFATELASSPAMADESGFTYLADILNLGGGVLFFISAACLLYTFINERKVDDLFFLLIATLLGFAAIMFHQSILWDFSWWSWHLLRLLAYAVAAYFALLSHQKAVEQIVELAGKLRIEVEDRKTAEQEARHLNAELEATQQQAIKMEKLSTVGSMVGGLAHEINNPLMGILNYVEYARKHVATDKAGETLDSAIEQVKRIDRLIKNLLLFSRNKQQDSTSAIELKPILDRVLMLIANQLRDAKTEVVTNIPDDLPEIMFNADNLEQVLINLLLNAKDAVNHDGTGSINVSARRAEDHVVIEVQDNGPGVPPKLRYKIFDPFYTTKAPEKGTGLGLSICEQLAETNHSELILEDSNEPGAVFQLHVRTKEAAS